MLQNWANHFLDETNYFAELKRLDKDPEVSEVRIRNLRELMATMDGVGNAPAERLENFLENITLDSDRAEEKENTGDAVTLITMHSCKGLEFPHVFIVGLEDGLLPHSRSKVEGTLDEERRLFYVAITRAMETLTITHCSGRKKYGQLLPLPTFAVPQRITGRISGTFRFQIQNPRRPVLGQKPLRGDARNDRPDRRLREFFTTACRAEALAKAG